MASKGIPIANPLWGTCLVAQGAKFRYLQIGQGKQNRARITVRARLSARS